MTKTEAIEKLQEMNADRIEIESLISQIDNIEDLENRQAFLQDACDKLEAKKKKLEDDTSVPEDTRQFEEMTFQQIKELRKDIDRIKNNTTAPAMTKDEILGIKDTNKRLKAISENMELFSENMPKRATSSYGVNHTLDSLGLTESDIDRMSFDDIQQIKSTSVRLKLINEKLKRG